MFLGLDIGGTKVAGVLLSEDGGLLDSSWANHRARTADDVVRLLSEVALQLTSGVPLERVSAGASIAGLIDAEGRVTRRGVLNLSRADIGGLMGAATGLTMVVVNDAEATLRTAVEHDPRGQVTDALMLALGTGVAGAAMWQGHLLRGRVGLAGELGHLPVLTQLPYQCVCGASGCLEQYASGRGLAERASAAARAGMAGDLLAAAGVSAGDLSSVHVVDAARGGIATALALVDDAAAAVAQALVAVAVTIEPERMYLGGSLGHAAADLLLSRIEQRLSARWPFPATLSPPDLVVDQVGPRAAALGAALLARDRTRLDHA